MRKRILFAVGILALVGGLGWWICTPKQLLTNGGLSRSFEGWETNAGVSIFRNPVTKDWRYYWTLVRAGGLLHLDDINNDRFAALGAGNVTGSVLSQKVALDGNGGRYGLSFLFAATGDKGTVGVVEVAVMDTNGLMLWREMLTNTQPVKTYYVPQKDQRLVKFEFEIPAGTRTVKLSFADKSPNGGVAVDPLVKQVKMWKGW